MKEKHSLLRMRSRPWRSRWKGRLKPHELGRVLPNLITLTALCLGLSSLQLAFLGQWQQAVANVLMAGFLDGLDGRLARLLKVSSDFGAELDSLADFVNFGVAPSLILYCFCLQQLGSKGWGISLFFSACMAFRLARFNSQRHTSHASIFSVGVPAPAGGLLAFLPLLVFFIFEWRLPPSISGIYMLAIALLLVSRYPTFVFKKIVIPPRYMGIFIISSLSLVVSLLSAPWESLLFLSFLYIGSLPLSGYYYNKGVR